MTIGELKDIIKDVPDDYTIYMPSEMMELTFVEVDYENQVVEIDY